jgi:hypothetical protein
MTPREWETFFALLEKIVNAPEGTYKEKAASVMLQAKNQGSETELNEFASWFQEG